MSEYQLTLKLPGLPNITSNGAHGSWRAKAAATRKWKEAVMLAVGQNKPPEPLRLAQIVVIRHSSYEPDYDNMVISMKPVIDGLKFAGIISDDKMSVIGRPDYKWEYSPRNKGFVTVEVGEIATDGGVAHGCAL